MNLKILVINLDHVWPRSGRRDSNSFFKKIKHSKFKLDICTVDSFVVARKLPVDGCTRLWTSSEASPYTSLSSRKIK